MRRLFSLRTLAVLAGFFALATAAGLGQVVPGVGGTSPSVYTVAYPDALATTAAIVTATTNKVVAGSTGKNTFIFFAGVQSAGTNSAATYNFEQGTTSSTPCDTNTKTLAPTALSAAAFAAGTISTFFSGSSVNAAAGGFTFLEFPYVLPTGYDLCIVSAGTTVNYKAVVFYAQH